MTEREHAGSGPKPKALVSSLGCRLNQADGALLSDRLRRLGFELVPEDFEGGVDLVVLNSCAVTASAARKSKLALRALRKAHPEAVSMLSGCSASLLASGKAPEDCGPFELLLPNSAKGSVASLLARHFKLGLQSEPPLAGPPQQGVFQENALSGSPFKTRAFLKVQDGCDSFCSYCIVPYARGRERSRDFEELLLDFKGLLAAGCKEIVLTGVNICAYRCGALDLAGLLRRLLDCDGRFRLRLSSTEPHPVVDSIVDLMASDSRLCRFLHLPLQNASPAILKAMGRPCSRERFKDYVERARSLVPGIHVGTDLITGFPGEDDALFEESFEFVQSLAFSNMHVFRFSPRKGVPAAEMPGQIPSSVAAARRQRLESLKSSMSLLFAKSQIGQALQVLTERPSSRVLGCGLSDNYLKVEFAGVNLRNNEFYPVKIDKTSTNGKVLGSIYHNDNVS